MPISTDLIQWSQNGIHDNFEFMIITVDNDTGWSYPEYYKNKSLVFKRLDEISEDLGRKVTEIYDLTLPIDPQVTSEKAWSI